MIKYSEEVFIFRSGGRCLMDINIMLEFLQEPNYHKQLSQNNSEVMIKARTRCQHEKLMIPKTYVFSLSEKNSEHYYLQHCCLVIKAFVFSIFVLMTKY